ncbi:MAG: hypothetical protein DME17_00725 [Candidatus Rokuibacteriota bacterium]|nr:MAG: hypothetical protein DME17_00725 [Candidatus Rokubacteria bacterium]PYN09540.1 MAG: hypothetical protein DME06_15210 [Candidatus Rokubacteria bacterium]
MNRMNRRILVGVAVGLVALVAAAAIGTTAYRAGVVRGLADAGRLPAPDASGGRVLYDGSYGPFWHHGPFVFGFFGFLFPLLGVVLIFGLLRAVFWGPRCAGPYRLTKAGGPPMLAEWHSRAHESTQERGQSA